MKIKKYIYGWKNNAKRRTLYGRRCWVLAWGKMNSVLVEFEDGNKEVISRHALKKYNERQDSGGDLDARSSGAWAMTGRWSLLGNYDVLVKHTVTTLIADDAILERAIKQGLPLLFQLGGMNGKIKSNP